MIQTILYFLIWGVFISMMMRFGCGAHVMGHRHHGQQNGEPDGNPTWTPPEKDIDSVCGMSVETKTAKSAVHDGRAYYFCSQNCRQKFEDSPATYVARAADSTRAMEHSHESHS